MGAHGPLWWPWCPCRVGYIPVFVSARVNKVECPLEEDGDGEKKRKGGKSEWCRGETEQGARCIYIYIYGESERSNEGWEGERGRKAGSGKQGEKSYTTGHLLLLCSPVLPTIGVHFKPVLRIVLPNVIDLSSMIPGHCTFSFCNHSRVIFPVIIMSAGDDGCFTTFTVVVDMSYDRSECLYAILTFLWTQLKKTEKSR